MEYADHLIGRIVEAPDNPRVGVLANELLREFQRGYPVDRLRLLLASSDNEVVAAAIWIAAELAEAGRPLLKEMLPLLKHPAKRARFYALDCLYWALDENGLELAAGVRLLDDADSAVRWKAMNLLSILSEEQIRAAFSQMQTEADGQLAHGLGWLLTKEAQTPDPILTAMRSNDSNMRRFAVIAAARLASTSSKGYELLREVSTEVDDELSGFARDKLRLVSQPS